MYIILKGIRALKRQRERRDRGERGKTGKEQMGERAGERENKGKEMFRQYIFKVIMLYFSVVSFPFCFSVLFFKKILG